MKECIACGCTDTNACMTPKGPCAWASHNPPICTACVDEDEDSMAEPPPIMCAHSWLFTDPATGYCVHCRTPFCEQVAA